MKTGISVFILTLLLTGSCFAGSNVAKVLVQDVWVDIGMGEVVHFSGLLEFSGYEGDHYLWSGQSGGVTFEFRVYDWASQVRAKRTGDFEVVWQQSGKTGEFQFNWGWGVDAHSDTAYADGGAAWCSTCEGPLGYDGCTHDGPPPADIPEWFFEEFKKQLKMMVWQLSVIAGLFLAWLGVKWGI